MRNKFISQSVLRLLAEYARKSSSPFSLALRDLGTLISTTARGVNLGWAVAPGLWAAALPLDLGVYKILFAGYVPFPVSRHILGTPFDKRPRLAM